MFKKKVPLNVYVSDILGCEVFRLVHYGSNTLIQDYLDTIVK